MSKSNSLRVYTSFLGTGGGGDTTSESLRQLECQGLGHGDSYGGQAVSVDCKLLGPRMRIIFEVVSSAVLWNSVCVWRGGARLRVDSDLRGWLVHVTTVSGTANNKGVSLTAWRFTCPDSRCHLRAASTHLAL